MDQDYVIVTGGAGFLGSHLIDRLVEGGRNVICIDSLITGRIDNIVQHIGKPGFVFVQQDVIDPFETMLNVSEIYNLACPASPPKYERDPVHTFKTCIFGAINMLDLARRNGAKVLQASTSEIYGDPPFSPQPESYRGNVNTVGPRSCYDEGKRGAETLFFDYHIQYGVEIKIARIFNTYGPRMSVDDGRVVSNFIAQALSGRDLTVYGDGMQTRSFCYVDDLISGLMKLMQSGPEMHEPVNLGNPGEFTIRELAQLVMEKTGKTPKLVYSELPKDDPLQRKPDIERARAKLGWVPKVPLSEGLDRTIPSIAEQLGLDDEPGNTARSA